MVSRAQAQEQTESDPPKDPRIGNTDLVRGIFVLLAAVLVGGFVFSRGLDPNATVGESAASSGAAGIGTTTINTSETAATNNVAGEQVLPPSTTAPITTIPPTTAATTRAPSEVTVLVVNGSGVAGVAGKGTSSLKAAGFVTAPPRNGNGAQTQSAILFKEGFELEANQVATLLNVAGTASVSAADPNNLPVENLAEALADAQRANVIVVIGSDGLISPS